MAGGDAAGANFKGWQAVFNSFTVAGRRNVSRCAYKNGKTKIITL